MHSITKTVFVVATIGVFFVFAKQVKACSIEAIFSVPFCAQYAYADAVFIGKVIDSQPFVDEHKRKYNRLTFAVEKTFKGQHSTTIEVFHPTQPYTTCDSVFEVNINEEWVILAHFGQDTTRLITEPESFNFALTTKRLCTRSAEVSWRTESP